MPTLKPGFTYGLSLLDALFCEHHPLSEYEQIYESEAEYGANWSRTFLYFVVPPNKWNGFGGSLTPWKKVNGKYDLTKWDDAYWERFVWFMELFKKLGIINTITLFDSCSQQKDFIADHPFNPSNNVQHYDGTNYIKPVSGNYKPYLDLVDKTCSIANNYRCWLEICNEATLCQGAKALPDWKKRYKDFHVAIKNQIRKTIKTKPIMVSVIGQEPGVSRGELFILAKEGCQWVSVHNIGTYDDWVKWSPCVHGFKQNISISTDGAKNYYDVAKNQKWELVRDIVTYCKKYEFNYEIHPRMGWQALLDGKENWIFKKIAGK